jgi:hypothetical protein
LRSFAVQLPVPCPFLVPPAHVQQRLAAVPQEKRSDAEPAREADQDPQVKEQPNWADIKTTAGQVTRLPEVILASFEKDTDKRVTVTLQRGTRY